MRNALAIGVLTLLCSANVWAAEYGIGLSAKSDDSLIYVPIDITSRIRVEPSVRFSNTNSKSVSTTPGFFATYETTYRTKIDQKEFALGVFGLTSVTDSARLYYGLRAAYIDAQSTYNIEERYTSPLTDISTRREKGSQDGYRLSPTLGFEYLINKHFSIGGEVEWFYLDVDGEFKVTDSDISNPTTSTYGQQSNGTDAHLIVRYMF